MENRFEHPIEHEIDTGGIQDLQDVAYMGVVKIVVLLRNPKC